MGSEEAQGGSGSAAPIPKAEVGDLEDVSWALSTAEASWLRGDKAESLKWLRRAAEAATEGSANKRAVILAKAAADLASQIGRNSMPPATAAPSTSPQVVATTARSGPAPPSRPSSPPRPGGGIAPSPPSQRPPALPPASQRPGAPSPPRAVSAPSPFTAAMHPSKMPLGPQVPAGSTLASSRTGEVKKTRRSGANLEAEARAARERTARKDDDTSPERAPKGSTKAARQSQTNEAKRRRPSRPPASEVQTEAAPAAPARPRSPSVTDEIDAWPTQQMQGEALSDLTKEMARMAPAAPAPRPSPSVPPPKPAGTTQAIRVLVWQSPEGVRVAPVGTPVEGPKVEAMLVALDPATDLASWLLRR